MPDHNAKHYSDVRTAAPVRTPSTSDRQARPDTTAPTAIIVWHGMGQQLPLETIELVAKGLAAREARLHNGVEPPIVTRTVRLGEQTLRRAELDLSSPRSGARCVHIYEGYWAPLAEGRITLAETVEFLLTAGWLGLRHSLRAPRALQRFLFNRWVSFPLSPALAPLYVYLLLTLASLVVVNLVITASLGIKVLTGPGSETGWPPYALLGSLTVDLVWLAVPFALLLGTLYGIYRTERANRRAVRPSQPRPLVRAGIWILLALSSIATIVVGGFMVYDVMRHTFTTAESRQWPVGVATFVNAFGSRTTVVLSAALWAIVLLASWRVRWFMLEFVGDSAIYVTSHTLNRYFETRQAIRNDALRLLRAIFECGNYRRHILVGHSLGSVIAYDSLNALLIEDRLNEGRLAVARRTALLLTFGSILDKTAFLFRAQSESTDIREALASATQPLISEAATRPRWVNLYSPHDVLAGSVDYYDLPDGVPPRTGEPAPRRIENMRDRHAWIPLIAHTQYWYNDLFLSTIADIVGEDESADHARQP
jgi:hypothetical protein